LVAYYTFDEPAGFTETTLTNTVGSYDGTLKGNPTWVTSGATLSKMVAPGNAMSFDGSDDYVAITNTTSEDFTLEAWIKPDGTGSAAGSNAFHGDGILWSDVSGSANDFVLAILGNNIAFWDGSADANGTGGNVTGNTDVVTDGEWHHIAVTRESGGSMILYVDGVPDGSATAGTNALTDNPAIHIGANTLNSRYYSGQIDEVRIWNTARSQTEIQADMYRALDSFESGLAAYYRFDQDSGTELVDVTSFDNDGTLNGSPTWVTSEVPMD